MMEHAKNISLFLVIGLLVNLAVSWLQSDFLSVFLSQNLITLLIALVAINTTTLSVVLSKVREIADKLGGSFSVTAKEMKLSIIEQVVLIVIAIIIQVVHASSWLKSQWLYLDFCSDVILIGIFFYAIYILYDTANSIFVILQFEDEMSKDKKLFAKKELQEREYKI